MKKVNFKSYVSVSNREVSFSLTPVVYFEWNKNSKNSFLLYWFCFGFSIEW